MSIEIGSHAPDFSLLDSDEHPRNLSEFRGKWIVLYFYPKDNTSGCTLEAIDFTSNLDEFKNLNTEVIGVSPDSSKSHCNFRDKHDLKVTLLSDPEHQLLESYNVWVLKKMYGREYFGVERSTFLIDPEGIVRQIWRKVKVKEHVNNVLNELKLQQNQKD